MASASNERRRYSRVNFQTEIELSQNSRTFRGQVIDLSLNGILIDTPKDYEIRADQPINALIMLADETEIRMQLALAHSSSDVLGFKCESIDVDSIAHLRRLIELNLNDPNAAERVLSELVAPKNHPPSNATP